MIRKAKLLLRLSLLTIGLSVFIILVVRPSWGIDFTGGSLLEFSTSSDVTEVRSIIERAGHGSSSVQETQDETLIVRTSPLSEEEHQRLREALLQNEALIEELRFESIGPTIGAELRRKALTAIVVVVLALIGYLAYTFREASGMISPWKFGIAAVYALIHDLFLVMALFVVLGRVAGVSIDTMFVTAMLALLGYSVNDTIVIFNRLKSEWQVQHKKGLIEVMDDAVRHSLVRSLNTSLTTLLVLSVLLLVGGSTIRWFIVALTAGTVVGTYSSIFVAPPLLYFLSKK